MITEKSVETPPSLKDKGKKRRMMMKMKKVSTKMGTTKGALTARRELRLVSTYKKAERGLILINTRGNRLGKMRSNYQPRT
jgi:hypothetical protein